MVTVSLPFSGMMEDYLDELGERISLDGASLKTRKLFHLLHPLTCDHDHAINWMETPHL